MVVGVGGDGDGRDRVSGELVEDELDAGFELGVMAGGEVLGGVFEQLLEALELGSLCAHGSGMPAPLRSLLAHFPQELGLA